MPTRREALALLAASPFLSRALHPSPGAMPEPIRDLAQAFLAPPPSTRPYVLWMWMGSNITAEGITRDLEAMRDAGIGGATIFSLADTVTPWSGVILKSPTPEIVTFTEPWWRLVRFAASECRRLNLELILHNCAGYETSGGPWITPELSMQEIVFSQHPVAAGSQPLQLTLARATIDPKPHQDWPIVFIPSQGKFGVPPSDARRTFYRDIAVLALPAKGTVSLDQIIDLTAQMNPQGELTWTPPAASATTDWIIYRFGHTSTGATIEPAQWGAMGLECDKMSRDAVTFHFRHVLDDIKRHIGDLIGNPGLSTLYCDSYEAGNPTWTPKMREEFVTRRGYDLTPYLAIFAARVLVGDAETARFKQDFQRTVMDLYRDVYWATPRTMAHQYGLAFIAEPYEGPWDTREVMHDLDHANMEFWTHGNKYAPQAARPVIDTAHTLGQRVIGAEAFTTAPELARWTEHPAWLKPIGDAAFCDGVNRLNIHHFVQQPWAPEYQPGNAMGQWGIHLGRYQTWWEPGKAWLTYLWRCQTLLQTGAFVPASPASSATFLPRTGTLDLKSIHRLHGEEHIYFVANLNSTPGVSGTAQCSFPISNLQPEIWDPVWATVRDAEGSTVSNGTTTFDLDFAPAQSFFVIFRKPRKQAPSSPPPRTVSLVAELSNPWTVSFDPQRGGPGTVTFPSLVDWTNHPEKGIRYFSGTAVYRQSFHLPQEPHQTQGKLLLDLGTVHNLATVTVNGKKLGVVWTAPWQIDISSAVTPGENHIEIAVTNVWANRLIGDEQQPPDLIWQIGDEKMKGGYFLKEFPDWFLKRQPRPSTGRHTFTTWNYFHDPNTPLSPSGLIGPVRLLG